MKWKPEQIQNHHLSLSDGQSYAKPFLLRKSHENPDIQHSIDASSTAFGNTKLKTMTLHWDEEVTYNISNTFDVIVACDFKWMCHLTAPFFEEYHNALACTVKLLLRNSGPLEAIFFSPKRGDTLDKLLEKVEENGLNFSIIENYDSEVWKCHQGFMAGDDSWPSYEKHHCYPLFVRIHYKLSRPFIFRSYPVFLGDGMKLLKKDSLSSSEHQHYFESIYVWLSLTRQRPSA